MRPVQNPTDFFMHQAEHHDETYKKEIEAFTSKLLDKKNCLLCKQEYDIAERVPRILVHCGHTFCTPCLSNFYQYILTLHSNERIRCPMCLKLVKNLSTLKSLPINHGIFVEIANNIKKSQSKYQKQPKIQNVPEYLFAEYERSRRRDLCLKNPPQIESNSGLPFCCVHPDRVDHFYCIFHKNSGCRECVETNHIRSVCKVIDTYEMSNQFDKLKAFLDLDIQFNIKRKDNVDQ